MRRSTDRILITHTGSLPRSANLAEQLRAKEAGERLDLSALDSLIAQSVEEVVTRQCAVGVDVINDGEQGKVAYSTYAKDRLSGLEDRDRPRPAIVVEDFPEYTQRLARERRTRGGPRNSDSMLSWTQT